MLASHCSTEESTLHDIVLELAPLNPIFKNILFTNILCYINQPLTTLKQIAHVLAIGMNN